MNDKYTSYYQDYIKAKIAKEYYDKYANGGNGKTNKPISGEKKKNTKRYILIGA